MKLPETVEGNGPTLATVIEIGRILEKARFEAPLSLAEIARRMEAKRVRHATIRAAVDFLAQLGFVTLGSKGAQWTHTRDRRFWSAARKGLPLARA